MVLLVQNLVELEDIRNKVEQVQRESGQTLVCYVSDVCLRLSEAPEAWNWINRAYDQDTFWQHPRDAGVWVARKLLEYPGLRGISLPTASSCFPLWRLGGRIRFKNSWT